MSLTSTDLIIQRMPRQGAVLGRGLVTEITANRAWIEWLGAELAIPYIGVPEVGQPIWLLQQGTTVVGLSSGGGNGGEPTGPPDWSEITNKPTLFPPTPQVLNWLTDVFIDTVADGQVLGYDGTTWTPMDVTASADWADIVGKPATFPPTPQPLDWLTDASGTGAIEGNLLGYASGQWVPVAPPVAIGGIAPVGTITMWPLETPPIGWLTCFGQAVSRTAYPDLFSVIGTAYGAGDGSTTFNLPNFIGRFPLGARAASTPTIGDTGGAWDHTHTQPTHTHTGPSHDHGSPTGSGGSHTHTIHGATTNVVGASGNRLYTHSASAERHGHDINADGVHTHVITSGGTGATGASGGDATGANNPPYLGIKYIIKATPGGADSGETNIAWADITGKPTAFPPIAQPLNWLTDVDTALAAEGRVLTYVSGSWVPVDPAAVAAIDWADITGKPSTFPPTPQSLDWLTNVDTAGVLTGQVLGFNGTNWTPVDAGSGGGGGAYLPLAGGTMAGNLNMGGFYLHTPSAPTAGHHVGDRAYNDARYVKAAGDTMTGILNMNNNQLQNLPKPVGDQQPLRRMDGYSIESVTGGPTIWIGTGSPSGGNNNDLWFRY